MESKKYSLFYDKDDIKLLNCLNKGNCRYFSNYYDDKPGLIHIGDFNNIDDAKDLYNVYMEKCSKNLFSYSKEEFDSFINNFDDYDNGYFYIDNTKEKVYLSKEENKYSIHINKNSNFMDEYIVKDLTSLFRKDRFDNYYLPSGYSQEDCSNIKLISHISVEKIYNDGINSEGWRFVITLDKNDGVFCCIFDPQGNKNDIENFLDIKKVRSPSEYYCQEGLLREINHLIDTGIISKR